MGGSLKRSAEHWKGERGLTLIRGWLRDGLTEKEIAKRIGIEQSTLDSWRRRHEEISEAFEWDINYMNFTVEEALYKSAVDGSVSAQTLWLKSKRPEVWNDKKDAAADSGVVEDLSPLADIWKESGGTAANESS